jgi:hypothetical protein
MKHSVAIALCLLTMSTAAFAQAPDEEIEKAIGVFDQGRVP